LGTHWMLWTRSILMPNARCHAPRRKFQVHRSHWSRPGGQAAGAGVPVLGLAVLVAGRPAAPAVGRAPVSAPAHTASEVFSAFRRRCETAVESARRVICGSSGPPGAGARWPVV